MSGLWKRGLAAQLTCFILAALVVSQALTFVISWNEHSKALDDAAKSEFFSRARTMTILMGTVPQQYRRATLLASETRDSRFWLSDRETMDERAWRQEAAAQFSRQLENFVDLVQVFSGEEAAENIPDPQAVAAANRAEAWKTPLQNLWALPERAKYVYFDGTRGYGLTIQIRDGQWLNAAFYMKDPGGWWTSTSLASLVVTAVVLAAIGILIASHIAQPLGNLAKSAEALGRGENLPPLREEGPEEIRSTAEAFNKMQKRLQRFIEDRTMMLAAIGHDLRTPLTSLRLQTEFLEDGAAKNKILSTINDLQGMTEAAIAFARGESTNEETREIQLEALVESVCDDLADIGQQVSYLEGDKFTYRCRPDGLRRAIRNLAENATRYGGQAKVFIEAGINHLDIIVEDCGPGIPDEMKEKVFAPYFRLEASRNRDTGGLGLGLSIARGLARQHGGDITLVNITGGMRAVLSLPFTDAPKAEHTPRHSVWAFAKSRGRAGSS